MQNVCNCEPHWAASDFSKWRNATEATRDESRPPERRTPKGTSVISLFITAYKKDHVHASKTFYSNRTEHFEDNLFKSIAED